MKKEGDEKLKKSIKILSSIIDESERKGNGNLKSLISLLKGETL